MIAWLTVRRLDWMLRTRGADLAAWPAPDREAARALLRRSVRAREVFADALAREEPPAPEPDTVARMLGAWRRRMVATSPIETGVRWGALAACAIAGLYLGVSIETADPVQDVFTVVQAAAVP